MNNKRQVNSIIIKTNIETDRINSNVSSKSSDVIYYPLSISAFSYAPQIMVEGVEIDGIDI